MYFEGGGSKTQVKCSTYFILEFLEAVEYHSNLQEIHAG